MPSTHTCATCAHFLLTDSPEAGDGECRHGVPAISVGGTSMWPVCAETDWCGSHSGLPVFGSTPRVRQPVRTNVRGTE